jgi:hypothetical protein
VTTYHLASQRFDDLPDSRDVPFLAGLALAATARSFEDIAELDFRRPGQDLDEIDIAAFGDGRLTIGEAKCVASLGTSKQASRAIGKLLRVSDLLGADEILLATTALGPWKEKETDQLLRATARHQMAVQEGTAGPGSNGAARRSPPMTCSNEHDLDPQPPGRDSANQLARRGFQGTLAAL